MNFYKCAIMSGFANRVTIIMQILVFYHAKLVIPALFLCEMIPIFKSIFLEGTCMS